jgi:hypothetical protein
VPIVDVVLVLATQPFHRLHRRAGVADLDLLRADPHLHRLADQPRRHRIGIVLDPDRAPPAHLHPLTLDRFQPLPRQRPQARQLRGQSLLAAGIALGHHRTQELPIRLAAAEVAMATQQQGLLHRFLQAAVPLLAVAVLVPAGGIRRLGLQPVMTQQPFVFRGVLLSLALVVDRQRHAVGAVPLRHPAQGPQRVLQPRAQAGEALRKTHRHVLPVRVGQHEMIDQVREGLAGDRHAQSRHVREIRSAQPAWLMHLGKVDLLGLAVLRLPAPHPPLQRPPRLVPRLLGQLTLQPLQQRLGLQAWLPFEQFLQPRPHSRQRIAPRPPGACWPLLAGQLGLIAVLSGRLAIHACTHRRLRQRCPPQESFPQCLHLGVRGASTGSHRQLLSPEVAAVLCRPRSPAQIFTGEA